MTVPHLVPQQVSSLAPFVEAGVFGLTEIHLAATLATADPTITPEVLLGAALAARAPLTGSVCIELGTIGDTVVSSLFEPTEHMVVDVAIDAGPTAGTRLDDDTDYVAPVDQNDSSTPLEDLEWPDVATWSSALGASSLVETIGADGLPIAHRSASDPLRPLVLEGQRLYLARYWYLERFVGDDLVKRTATSSTHAVEADAVGRRIADLFELAAKASGTEPDDGQVAAARAVAERDLVVISGGPGTGKTTTVAHLLAGLVWSQADAHAGGAAGMAAARDRIALVAPTGKAAARMTEAIQEAVGRLSSALPTEVVEQLNSLEAVTIHRLLGRRGAGFWRGPDSPLTHDLVIVDEVSMVSLSLIAHLLAAIPHGAKVVLVGDPYQLASVEAGTVLGDIVGVSRSAGSEHAAPIAPTLIAPSVRPLATVHRQKAGSGIVDLATAIRGGRTDEVIDMLQRGESPDLCWVDAAVIDGSSSGSGTAVHAAAPSPGEPVRQPTLFEAGLGAAETDPARQREHRRRFEAVRSELWSTALAAVRAAGEANEAEAEALAAILSTKVLCALRRGPAGVDQWNRLVEEHLRLEGAIRRGDWYAGRPTMVTENDYLNNVFNGDVGVALRSTTTATDGPDAAGYRVLFQRGGTHQEVPAIRLDRVVTQWAMSIHKSQGSEFPHAVVVLPPPPARILTRELLYTGVTRAKERLTLVASEESIRAAVDRPVARASGLATRLS